MSKSLLPEQFIVVAFIAASVTSLHASGDYALPRWLDQGGAAALHSPEFFWEAEVRKLASAFTPSEKRVLVLGREAVRGVDIKDFESTQPTPDALTKHRAACDTIQTANETTTVPLPAEDPSEFTDYHRGAFAFHLGVKHYAEAETAWKALLNRPTAERHHRSVWAAFMLGKLALFGKSPEAVKWFKMTRELAKDGFADSLGLAADSYGWEAKSELDQGNWEKAAPLYLTQLALGDDSAIVSLKAVVSDRDAGFGTLSFRPSLPDNADADTLAKFENEQKARAAEGLDRAARDPLLRRIVTAHVLATESVADNWLYGGGEEPEISRSKSWLAAIEKAGVATVADATALGWVAYTGGDYAQAERWLKLSKDQTSANWWLRSRLQRRAGQLDAAAKSMSEAFKLVQTDPPLSKDAAEDGNFVLFHTGLSPRQSASADLGTLNLTRGDFVAAFETFDAGDMPADAAYVAEHVLTCDELKKSIDARYPWSDELDKRAAEHTSRWDENAPKGFDQRWMLGRRLIREDRYAEARPYLPTQYREVLERYTQALNAAANEKLPKAKRARAWFDAAVIARFDGMELMGTEAEPDNFMQGGSFEIPDVAEERETGKTVEITFNDKGEQIKTPKPLKLVIPVSEAEKKRLAKNRPSPNKRFHYRYVAAAIAWRAAQLLPDNSDELADVLNSAGTWIKTDDKAADKYFQAIEHRASKTELGKEAGAKHWFVEHYGPWSEAPKEQ